MSGVNNLDAFDTLVVHGTLSGVRVDLRQALGDSFSEIFMEDLYQLWKHKLRFRSFKYRRQLLEDLLRDEASIDSMNKPSVPLPQSPLIRVPHSSCPNSEAVTSAVDTQRHSRPQITPVIQGGSRKRTRLGGQLDGVDDSASDSEQHRVALPKEKVIQTGSGGGKPIAPNISLSLESIIDDFEETELEATAEAEDGSSCPSGVFRCDYEDVDLGTGDDSPELLIAQFVGTGKREENFGCDKWGLFLGTVTDRPFAPSFVSKRKGFSSFGVQNVTFRSGMLRTDALLLINPAASTQTVESEFGHFTLTMQLTTGETSSL